MTATRDIRDLRPATTGPARSPARSRAHDPADPATLLVARAIAARDLADYATALVPAIGGDEDGRHGMDPAADIYTARRARTLLYRLTCVCVIRARAGGAAWPQVGEAFGLSGAQARQLYGGVVARWEAGDRAPWNPDAKASPGLLMSVAAAPPIPTGDPAVLAAELDDWCRRHIAHHGRDLAGPQPRRGVRRLWRPVSDGLPTSV